MSAQQELLRLIFPASWFEALKAESKLWLVQCPCGHERDLWEAGGVRFKALGEPRRYLHCPACGRARWHVLRKVG